MNHCKPHLLFAIFALAWAAPAAGQCLPVPGDGNVGSGVPAPARVLGHELGERFTSVAGVERYFDALAEASPLVRVRPYGTTPEGRQLRQVVIASADNMARLDEILARNARLADPATTEREAAAIIAGNPLIVYFSYGVHGNEASSSDAAVWTAWDLVRGEVRGSGPAAGVLDSIVVVMDPVANPDGRARYVGWYRQARAAQPNPDGQAREHWEPWPGGRYNHYLFDLNRDWAFVTQPETKARTATWEMWWPQVVVDFHEMSASSSYFFFPAAEPINPMYPPHILQWGEYFGDANAQAFDRCGWEYFTGEAYDLFYPGYGDSWPALLGSIGMTYEQAGGGNAGLALERADGTLLTLWDRAQHHRTSGLATLRAAAHARTPLLRDFARFHRTVGEELPDFLIPRDALGRADELVAMLRRQGIVVQRATREFEASARPHPGFAHRTSFAAGTYRVPARQARGRLVATLLQPETVLDATYSYDLSAWSLPYAFGVAAFATGSVPGGIWETVPAALEPLAGSAAAMPVQREARANTELNEPYAYLVRPSLDGWRGVVRLLQDGVRAVAMRDEFELEGTWPAGTIFIPRAGNFELTARVRAAGLGDVAVAVGSGLTTRGPDLGTAETIPLRLPRVGVIAGEGVSATSFGAHWFFLEQTLGMPFDALATDALPSIELDEFDVLVLPSGGFARDSAVLERLREWVAEGGTLVAIGSAAAAVAEPIAGVQVREEAEAEDEGDERLSRALRGREARDLEQWEDEIPGTILPITLDSAHPLAFGAGAAGMPDRMFVLHTGGPIFEPSTSFESVAHFPAEVRALSGVISEQNLEQLARGTWLAMAEHGSGNVVLFGDDPLFRHFWYGAFPLYVNALLLAHTD